MFIVVLTEAIKYTYNIKWVMSSNSLIVLNTTMGIIQNLESYQIVAGSRRLL